MRGTPATVDTSHTETGLIQTTFAGVDARENQLDDHDRELSSPGSQPVTVTKTVGSRRWMFRDRDREPVNCFKKVTFFANLGVGVVLCQSHVEAKIG